MTKREKLKAWLDYKKAARDQRRGARREWIRNHPREFTWLVVIGVSTTGSVAKTYINYKLRTATQKPKQIWDPSMGYHQNLKRPLTPELKADINRLTGRGYTRHEALEMLGLI